MPSLVEMTEDEVVVDDLINNVLKRLRSPIGDTMLSKLNHVIKLTGKCTPLMSCNNDISKNNNFPKAIWEEEVGDLHKSNSVKEYSKDEEEEEMHKKSEEMHKKSEVGDLHKSDSVKEYSKDEEEEETHKKSEETHKKSEVDDYKCARRGVGELFMTIVN